MREGRRDETKTESEKGVEGKRTKGRMEERGRDDRSRPVEKGYSRRETTIGRTLGRGWEEERRGETGGADRGVGGEYGRIHRELKDESINPSNTQWLPSQIEHYVTYK